MASAMDVANFFIDVFKGTDDPMTMLRAMKLTYYAQGHSLARLNAPIFDEDIEAQTHGPVIPSVCRSLARCKDNSIRKTVGEYSKRVFSPEQIKLLTDVGVSYGMFTTGTLSSMSRAPYGPWGKVCTQNRRDSKIPKELIREHFSVNERLKVFDIEFAIKNMRPLGPCDPEGNTILPKDLDD